jgi:formamidopyrimidine-DNA glycosylase
MCAATGTVLVPADEPTGPRHHAACRPAEPDSAAIGLPFRPGTGQAQVGVAGIGGGDYWEGRRQPGDDHWARVALTFDDGGRLMLVDPRPLGRVRLSRPCLGSARCPADHASQFRIAFAVGGAAAAKARIMDQGQIAGSGSLLADEILRCSRLHPARAVGRLNPA